MIIDSVTSALLRAAGFASDACVRLREQATVAFKWPPVPAEDWRSLPGPIVTSADLLVQEEVLRCFREDGLGGFRLTAEEDTQSVARFGSCRDIRLYIDPIDGTLAYALGVPQFEEACERVGVPMSTVARARALTDRSAYGIVLGAELDQGGTTVVCSLPERGVCLYSTHGGVYMNGLRCSAPRDSRGLRVSVNRRTLTNNGVFPELESAGIPYELHGGSSPYALEKLISGRCNAYLSPSIGFDAQLMLSVARDAGYTVCDLEGNPLALDFDRRIGGAIAALTQANIELLAKAVSGAIRTSRRFS